MKIITVASLKGGAGKTTIAVFLTRALSRMGKRVLAVDLDHNNNLTDYFLRGKDPLRLENVNVYHALTGRASIQNCLYGSSDLTGIGVLPCTISLSKIGSELARDPGALLRFAPQLKKLQYDFVIIDTPPALCFELSAGLSVANVVLSPLSLSRWTAQGYAMLTDELEQVGETTGQKAEARAVAAMVTATQAEKLVCTKLANFTNTVIHKSASLKIACDHGRALKADTKGFNEFLSLAQELISGSL